MYCPQDKVGLFFEMPVFKLVYQSKPKKLCVATDIKGIISFATLKYNLEKDVTYKIVLESDGTEIDDDEVLMELNNVSKEMIVLRILREDEEWNEQKNENNSNFLNVPSTSAGLGLGTSSQIDVPKASTSQSKKASTNLNIDLDAGLWNKLPSYIFENCEKGEKLSARERRLINSTVANYMIDVLKSPHRATAAKIAEMICKKYPNTFVDVVGPDQWGDGINTMRLQIYNACLYRKKPQEPLNKRPRRDSDEDDLEKRNSEYKLAKRQDEYGCINFTQPLPESETIDSQEEKRLKLKTFFENPTTEKIEVNKLMKDVYPTVRLVLNQKQRNLDEIFENWPYLKEKQVLLEHSSILLGKDVQTIWNESLSTKAKIIRRFFMNNVNEKSEKSKNKHKQLVKIISEYKNYADINNDKTPKTLMVFPLLTTFFEEDIQHLILMVKKEIPDNDMTKGVETEYPILIVKGDSMCDEDITIKLVVGGRHEIVCDNILNGVLLTFLSYYVFGYAYSPNVEKTLEFLQRVFLKINPFQGSKKSGQGKRKHSSLDSAVINLAKSLTKFSSEFSTENVND